MRCILLIVGAFFVGGIGGAMAMALAAAHAYDKGRSDERRIYRYREGGSNGESGR